MKVVYIFFFAALVGLCAGACTSPLANAVVPPGYCATVWTTNVNTPRGITTAANGDVLVVERGIAQVSLFYRNTAGTLVKVALATASGLNHGIAIYNNYLYASSASTVFRWRYYAGNRTSLGTAQTVVNNIPTPGHSTRTLHFNNGLLLVAIGSNANVDSNADRAGIRAFNLSGTLPKTFTSGSWFARGLRNEVAVGSDSTGTVWGVENGIDNLNRADLGGDIHNDNPGEEINRFSTPNQFYGYPYCWSQYNLTTVATPRGTQYAHPNFISDGTHTDAWCQNTANVVKPQYQLRPHVAPLGLLFYPGGNFPNATGNLFVSEHGSWNRVPAQGYRVTQVTFAGGVPVSDSPLLRYVGPGDTGSGWHRPVDIALLRAGVVEPIDRMLVTSDTTNTIISIQYSP